MEPSTAPTGRLWTAAFVRLTAMDLAYFLAAGLFVYALPLYAVGPVHAAAAGAGLAFGAYSLTALALRPWAGRLSDRFGRRRLMVSGAALAAVCALGFLVTSTIAAVVAVRLLMGVAEAAFFVAGFAALADVAPPGRAGEALSYNSMALYGGLALGPPLGERLIGWAGYAAAWWAAAALCAVAALFAQAFDDRAQDRTPAPGPARLIHRPSLKVALGLLGGLVASAGFLAFAAIRAVEIGSRAPSLVLLTYGAVVVAGRIAFARAADRGSPLRHLAGALALTAAGAGLAALTASVPTLLLAAAIIGIGVSVLTPAYFAAVFATVGPRERGAAAGTASVFIDLGIGGGPIVLGLLAQAQGLQAAFAGGAIAAIAAAAWTAWLAAGRASAAHKG
ncbi:MAG TPA: MFS transporter [Intrasporangium sp.]|uniref:MFS transporter n=1 Tax=Intrasporangium sp. TaxID=1925024 RepID=UPI002D784F31|nr:MFS transporter [Intrasporangium sp.]HET7399778.1 MFS transporter [Intrasporangium sp.]